LATLDDILPKSVVKIKLRELNKFRPKKITVYRKHGWSTLIFYPSVGKFSMGWLFIVSKEGNSSRAKSGLALVSLEDKMKALFLKNFMLKRVDRVLAYAPDFLYVNRQS
jgi:hypothetical protein